MLCLYLGTATFSLKLTSQHNQSSETSKKIFRKINVLIVFSHEFPFTACLSPRPTGFKLWLAAKSIKNDVFCVSNHSLKHGWPHR